MSTPRGLLLVDHSSLLYRAFFSMPDTVPMHGVHGLLGMLARLIADRRPAEIAICVDDDWRPSWRVEALPSYKTHRVATDDAPDDPIAPQEECSRAVLRALGVAVVGAADYEAEDIIATLAARVRGRVEIVSGDRDLFALVRDPDVAVLYPQRGTSQLIVVDEAEITRRYGIPGRSYGEFALLRGDPSDGLPGVPGIGEKTAARLMATYGSIDAVVAASDLAPAVRRRLDAAHEYLVAARRVVPPVATVALPTIDSSLPARPSDPAQLAALADTHRLGGAIERFQRALTESSQPA